jgi:hypothetical protein
MLLGSEGCWSDGEAAARVVELGDPLVEWSGVGKYMKK